MNLIKKYKYCRLRTKKLIKIIVLIVFLLSLGLGIGLGVGLRQRYLNENYVINNYLIAVTGKDIGTKLDSTNNSSSINFSITDNSSQYNYEMVVQANKKIVNLAGANSDNGLLFKINEISVNSTIYKYLSFDYGNLGDTTGRYGLFFDGITTTTNTDDSNYNILQIFGYENAPEQNLSLTIKR